MITSNNDIDDTNGLYPKIFSLVPLTPNRKSKHIIITFGGFTS